MMHRHLFALLALPASLLAQGADPLARGQVMQAGAPVAADATATTAPTWDMDVRSYEFDERVQHYVALFTGKAKERITERLDRGSRFETMIRAQLKAGGVAEDLYYLALIESGFDPDAYSKAAAVGMWQFMASTAKDMGMRVDWWVDERRDPVRSTHAAARFIRDLTGQFNSVYLAAAAYNGGPGRVKRGIARYADDLGGAGAEDAFFLLSDRNQFKTETKDYVPQLIAAALIAKEPAKYGMELHARDAFVYDSVRVAGATPLAAIAHACGTTTAQVAGLNPHILRGMTAPGDSAFIRVPVGTSGSFDSAFALLSAPERIALHRVETRKGDTPLGFASSHDIQLATLKSFNPKMRRLKNGNLAPGQVLVVPTAAVASAARNVPDPAIEKYPKRVRARAVTSKRKGTTAKSRGSATRKKASSRTAAARKAKPKSKQKTRSGRVDHSPSRT